MIYKKQLLNWLLICFFGFFGIFITFNFQNPLLHLISYWVIIFVAILISKFDLLHPYFWFSIFFGLYSSSYLIILLMGYETTTGYTSENMFFSIIALLTTLLVIGPKKNKITVEKFTCNNEIHSNNLIKKVIIYLSIPLIICVFLISRLDFSSKTELVNNRYIPFLLAAYLVRFITLFISLYIISYNKKQKNNKLIFIAGLSVLLFTLFTAERDGFFRYLIIVIFSLFAIKKIKFKHFPIILLCGIFSILSITYLKYYFVSGNVRDGFLNNNIIYNFFNSDFAAAGENLQVLINNPWTKSLFGIKILFYDLIEPFNIGSNIFNVSIWFNNYFYFGKYSRAFTLVGEGYVIGGIIGVIIIFLIIGLSIKFLYNKANKNEYWLTIYLYYIVTVASSFRGTLGGILSSMIRIALFGIVFILILDILFKKKYSEKLVMKNKLT